MPTARFMSEGSDVFFEIDGRTFRVGWEKALELAGALREAARRAEEYAKANQIIADGAILLRAGFPIGLSNRPDIKAEVRKEAQHNKHLRRYMPAPSIPPAETWGVPRVLQPKTLKQRLAAMTDLERAELRRLIN